jgi:hypothetical protein
MNALTKSDRQGRTIRSVEKYGGMRVRGIGCECGFKEELILGAELRMKAINSKIGGILGGDRWPRKVVQTKDHNTLNF